MIAIVTFPGSNGDADALHAVRDDLGAPARLVDYRETDLSGFDAVILPGGFSYGDALRCGAIARFAPVIEPIRAFAARGGPVLGICNGFQILTEAHLLPGALRRNATLRFHCRWVHVRVESATTAWTDTVEAGTVLRLPVAHGDGSFVAGADVLAEIEANGQVVVRYCEPDGTVSAASNPNGSAGAIAGVANRAGNVVGLMPHPERAVDPLLGGEDGQMILRGVLERTHVAS